MEHSRISTLFDATNVDDWSKALFQLAHQYGYQSVLFTLLRPHQKTLSQAFTVTNYSLKWQQQYLLGQYKFFEEFLKSFPQEKNPVHWTPDGICLEDFWLNRFDNKLWQCLLFPYNQQNEQYGFISFGLSTDDKHPSLPKRETVEPILNLIKYCAFSSALALTKNLVVDAKSKLTKRELEILSWMKEGKSSWEISKIVNCSVPTVKFHTKNIRLKFGVNTKQQAVLKAVQLGLLSL